MKSLKVLFILMLAVTLMSVTTGCKKNLKEVAIVQYVTDAPLDDAREGIIAALKEAGYVDKENITISIYNCNADASTVVQSVRTAVSRSDLIFAIATPVAQVVVKELEKQGLDTPVLFTAVTDPVASNILKDSKNPGGNVSGTSDLNAVEKQIELAKLMNPDAKKVGFLYTAGEHNSIVQLNLAKEAGEKFGLEIVPQSITKENELPDVAKNLCSTGVDAIYIPTDNKVVANCNIVVDEANLNKIPTICAESSPIHKGATITIGSVVYKELGKLTGKMGARILKEGIKAGSMPVEYYKSDLLEINLTEANKHGIKISQDLINKADKTY